MSIDTFQYDKKTTFASRLFSISVTEPNKRHRKNLIESISKEQKLDLIVSVNTDPPQIMMAETAAGYKKDMVAASAMVADKMTENNVRDFICVILLGNGNYLITIQKDGEITHDFIGKLSDAATIVNEEYRKNAGTWQRIILPKMLETLETIYNREEVTLDYFIPKNKKGKPSFKKYRLKPVSTRLITPKNIIILMIAGGALWAGNKAWEKYQQHLLDKEIKAMQLEEKRRLQDSVVKIDNPWKNEPLPDEFIRTCKSAYNRFNLWTGGWMLSEVNCSGSAAAFKWVRKKNGFLEQIRNTIRKINIHPGGNSASLSIRLQPETGTEEEVPDGKETKLAMLSKAQLYQLNMSIDNPKPPPLPDYDPKSPPPIYHFNQIQWKAETQNPELFAGIFNGPGFRIKNMTAFINEEGGIQWSIQGIQYVKKP